MHYSGHYGLLDIAVAPDFNNTRSIYLSFVEPGREGSGPALARAQLVESEQRASLAKLEVIWRQLPKGSGSQPGGVIAFSPDGKHLFLTSVDRRRPQTAQDINSALGKVIRLNLDASTPQDNPLAAQGGVAAQIWTSGHRNPYGLAFAPNGFLWLHEMGPSGSDELNLIKGGRNYGWPVVSKGIIMTAPKFPITTPPRSRSSFLLLDASHRTRWPGILQPTTFRGLAGLCAHGCTGW